MAQRAVAGSGYRCSHTVIPGCLLDGHESGCFRSVCPLTAGTHRSGSPPRFRPDGGYGSVATLVGSNHPGLGLLIRYDWTFHGQCFLDLSLYFTGYVALFPPAARHSRILLVRGFSSLPHCVG